MTERIPITGSLTFREDHPRHPPSMRETTIWWEGGDIAAVSDELWPMFEAEMNAGSFWPWEFDILGHADDGGQYEGARCTFIRRRPAND